MSELARKRLKKESDLILYHAGDAQVNTDSWSKPAGIVTTFGASNLSIRYSNRPDYENPYFIRLPKDTYSKYSKVKIKAYSAGKNYLTNISISTATNGIRFDQDTIDSFTSLDAFKLTTTETEYVVDISNANSLYITLCFQPSTDAYNPSTKNDTIFVTDIRLCT